MFERYGHEARACVTLAREEASALGHGRITPAHLLLGVARVRPALVACDPDRLRDALGQADGPRPPAAPPDAPGTLPFTATAEVALTTAAQDAVRDGAAPHDLLLALAQVAPAALRAHGVEPGAARERALAARAERERRPSSLPELLRGHDPVEVRLGVHLVGDLGHPSVDARLVEAVLARGGRFAALLREHGVDEALLARWARSD